MGEDALARLAVINRASCKITTDRRTNHHRAGEAVVGPPAKRDELVANLHHRRPDIIKKLDLHHRLQPPRRHTHGSAHDAGLGKLRVVAAGTAELALKPVRRFEHPTFALYPGQLVFVTAVGHVLTKHNHARIATHFIAQAE